MLAAQQSSVVPNWVRPRYGGIWGPRAKARLDYDIDHLSLKIILQSA